jgi:hypothetical protein
MPPERHWWQLALNGHPCHSKFSLENKIGRLVFHNRMPISTALDRPIVSGSRPTRPRRSCVGPGLAPFSQQTAREGRVSPHRLCESLRSASPPATPCRTAAAGGGLRRTMAGASRGSFDVGACLRLVGAGHVGPQLCPHRTLAGQALNRPIGGRRGSYPGLCARHAEPCTHWG